MSLIAYADGWLVADRIGVENREENRHYDMQKLFVSSTKMFAYAYCGDTLVKRLHDDLHEGLLMMLALHCVTGKGDYPLMPEEFRHVFGDRGMIVMTKDRIFHRAAGKHFSEVDDDHVVGSGTYEGAFKIAHSFGYPPKKAAFEAVKFLVGMDPVIDAVNRKSLRQFPKVKKSEKAS